MDEKTHRYDDSSVRVTITLNRDVYEEIKRISSLLGLKPATWMSLICTTKANNIGIRLNYESWIGHHDVERTHQD